MPLENTLNVDPYFDDYDQAKEFYKILFKPGVAVQTRELNQLQSILQNQIERFGNHVFKSGTIASGINFSYLSNYSYIKINDIQTDGQPSYPSSYVDYFVKSDLDLTGRIVNYQDGLESKTPELKTLYIQYNNSSNPDTANGNAIYTQFNPNQQLTVFSKEYPLFVITTVGGGLGFSNSDTVVVLSAITVSGNTVAFSNSETITQSTTGAKGVIASINTTAVANTTILSIKPRTVDLTNNSVNSVSWSMSTGYNIVGGTSGATANVVSLVGSGATGLITTDTQGIIQRVTLSEIGSGYTYLPFVTVKTANTTATVNDLNFTAKNYKTIITVANSSVNAVGAGYAFSVSEGIIYQKGFFLKVDPQVIVIDKYSTSPNNVVVGFKTNEVLVDSNEDETLYDNAAGTTNYSAPGADRLQLTPTLVTLTPDEAASNTDFFTLAEWKEGFPYKENRVTVYSNLADEFARRTREAQGNFVVDSFQVSTKEKSTANTTYVQTLIDPGTAYISGYRVQTTFNNYLDQARSTTTASQTNQSVTVNYGNYIKVKELAGLFNFKAGDAVALYDTAVGYVTAGTITSTGSITPAGSSIGTARMRSLVLDTGDPGTAACTYRLYLFDVTMSAGKSFRNVKSVYYDGTIQDGIADIVLTYSATTSSYVAAMNDVNTNQMLFPVGQDAVSSLTNITYTYRTTSSSTLQLTASGLLAIGPLGSGLTLPYSDGVLSSTSEKDFIVFPIANAVASSNVAGTLTSTNTSNVVTGVTTTFATDFTVGDFIKIANSSVNIVKQISAITNNTSMQLSSVAGTSIASANGVLFFPALYPLSLENRSTRTVTISGSSKTATIDISKTLAGTVNAIAVYNIKSTAASPVTKTINRNLYVKLHTSNNTGSNTGPWFLGVPGVARMRNVYLGSNTTVNASSTDVTKYFYVDTGEDENAYRSSRLVLQPGTGLTLTANQYLMVKLDAFTTGGQEGFFTSGSYSINDTANLASSTSTINTLEIPEVLTKTGQYYDLRDVIDFRPYANSTANLSTTVAGATVNPANTFGLSGDDQFFPVPDSDVTFDVSYYNTRQDRVVVNSDSVFEVLQGTPALTKPIPPTQPNQTVTLSVLNIPGYPSLPRTLNAATLEFASRKVGSDRGMLDRRISKFTIGNAVNIVSGKRTEQIKRFTMEDIGKIERRLVNVENFVSLNDIEKSIKEIVIPSGITPTTSRFKHGFFVEPFNDYSRADTGNKEFAATIDQQNGFVKPPTRQVNYESQFDRSDATTLAGIIGDTTLMLPYTNQILINQSVKSSIIGSDGQNVGFVGEAKITPASFSIRTRGEVTLIPDPPPPDTGGGPGDGGWSGGGADSGGGKIVCTMMNRMYGFGRADNRLWIEYSRDEDPAYEMAYHKLAMPFVKLMPKYTVVRVIAEAMADSRTEMIKRRHQGKLGPLRYYVYHALWMPPFMLTVLGFKLGLLKKADISQLDMVKLGKFTKKMKD